MRRFVFLVTIFLFARECCQAQSRREDIYTDFVFYNKRQRLEMDLRENIIAKTFAQTLTTDNEHKFESACWAISQFMFRNDIVESGFRKIIASYDSLQLDTKRAFLEAVYGIYPSEFKKEIDIIFQKETHPKLFAMCALYLYRLNHSTEGINSIKLKMVERFSDYDSTDLLIELDKYLTKQQAFIKQPVPAIPDLIRYQKQSHNKIIYSFQRWNRDYPGLAIVQNGDGSFAKREDGRIMVFEQLARSASALPYFITNGNTPQGIYSIQGTGVANNNYIGPTPNVQLIMPFEDSLQKFFLGNWDSSIAPLKAYHSLLPSSWRNYEPINEAFYSGKIGRTEIIAHGTTIDPEYFKDYPWYPISPTLGCLCAKELWNVTSGRLLVSEQFNLYSAFTSTPGNKGFLIVVNLDDQQKAVSRDEIERLVK